MIIREHYLRQIRKFYDSDLIKIITGIRRCGKSVLLQQIATEIRDGGGQVIMLNFEDKLISGNIHNADDLLRYISEKRTSEKLYLFLDEVQELEKWYEACKTLRLHEVSLFIAGSNSRLLAGEFTKFLSGRYVAFRVRPFVYKELCAYAAELGKNITVADYLLWGGFPGRIEQIDNEAARQYLNDLDNTIVINDLIRRYKIRKTALFSALVNYVLRSNARIFSAKAIRDYIKQTHSSCSVNTIMKYLDCLREAYIIDGLKLYSAKTRQELAYYEKIYNADVAFNTLRCPDSRYDVTYNLENIVHNELAYRGYHLTVYNSQGREIDFLAEKDGYKYYVQVAYSVAEEKAYNREFSAFETLTQLDRKIIITNDEIDYSTSNVEHLRLKDFLLREDL